MSSRSYHDRVGELVGGKYRLTRFLAEGGMGVVFEAQHTVLGRRFAVKFLRPELVARRESLVRFEREARAVGSLENENVAAAVDFGITEAGAPFLVMEFLVGESLATLLAREGRLPPGRAVDLILQACRGVHAVHAAHILHRDLKPQNLFVCRGADGTDQVKILDFGVAKLAQASSRAENGAETEAATRSGAVLGTAGYMAPEQARGETVDARADVYALGAILYELLSGAKPHPGESQHAVLYHITTQPPLALDAGALGLSRGLVDVVMGALSAAPQARPPTVEVLAATLAPHATHRPWPQPTAATTTNEAAPTAGARGDEEWVVPPSPARRATRERRAAITVAVAIGLAALLATAWRLRSGTPPAHVHKTLPPDTQFFTPVPPRGAVQQIANLTKAQAAGDAARLAAMAATPKGVWFTGGTPAQVQADVQNTLARAARAHRMPVLIPYNLPFRDCALYGVGGAHDPDAYSSWIEAFARGIANNKVVVILEPSSLGIIPNNVSLDGTVDWCKPTVADATGKDVPAPGGDPQTRYAQLRHALAMLETHAPNALVYLDGTHPDWLNIADASFRLVKAGVDRAQGFFVNASSFRPTAHAIHYGTWISKCIAYAQRMDADAEQVRRFRACHDQPYAEKADHPQEWALVDRWYVEHIDAPTPRTTGRPLTTFVIDTSRNGQPPFSARTYAAAPYSQPEAVVQKVAASAWCNPPGAGVGPRPTANTTVPLVDAFLWFKVPGESDGSCDIAGGVRAWDYTRYNPWGITGESQAHFDPLWGMVDPSVGEWFPEQALELATRADPPLDQ